MANHTRSEESLQRALLRYGDTAFRICYMHTKSPKETRALLDDIFMQYFLHVKDFENPEAERQWVLRTTHLSCMDYYSKKLRKTPSHAEIQQAGRNLEFMLTDELCTIMKLHYSNLTAIALCYGEGDTPQLAAKVTRTPLHTVKKRLEKAPQTAKLSPEDFEEWVQTIFMPEDMRARVIHDILSEANDKHFGINRRAKIFVRHAERSVPLIAALVVCFCIVAVIGTRTGWFGYEYIRTTDSGNTNIQLNEDPNSDGRVPETENKNSNEQAVTLKINYFVPTTDGLTEYICRMEADGTLVAEKMAEKGTFPKDVTLDNVLYVRDGEVVATLKSGEQLQVRLYFSAALQEYLNTADAPLTTLEAIAKTYHAFYDAANMTLATLEIYSGDVQVTVDGEIVNCSALMNGGLPVIETIKE